jgi:hypothetical protein
MKPAWVLINRNTNEIATRITCGKNGFMSTRLAVYPSRQDARVDKHPYEEVTRITLEVDKP